MPIRVVVSGELELRTDDVDQSLVSEIKAALSFKNEDKETAAREQVAGWWSMPDTIDLWRVEARRSGEVLLMPRGFAGELYRGLRALNLTVDFDDRRVAPLAARGYFHPLQMRDYQLDAIKDMMNAEQGVFECPAGGGKTIAMIGFAALANVRTLVIIDKADIVDQWREEAAQEWLDKKNGIRGLGLSLDPDDERSSGKIGQGVWEEGDFTVALRQTLWSRLTEISVTSWWDQWGAVIFDEGHHLSSDTLGEISRHAQSRYLIAPTATPARTKTKGEIVHALIGPVVHRTSRELLRRRGILVEPYVRRIPTKFEAQFWPTHTAASGEECQVPNCKKSGKHHQHRNNYTSVQKKLVEDKDRNALVARMVVSEPDRIHLLPSRQLKHLDIMKKAILAAGWEGEIFMLRGEENARGESREIVQAIKDSKKGSVVLSTVADEALNIPPIDRVHITFPMRQSAATEQLVGRGERAWPGKKDAVILDYVDELVKVFADQAEKRARTYRRLGYRIEREHGPEPIRFSSGPYSSFCADWPITVAHPIRTHEDITVITREHLFQAYKATNEKDCDHVLAAPTAAEAKARGGPGGIKLRDDWEDVKFEMMTGIISVQCAQHEQLRKMLLATGDCDIIEARPDPIWGEGSDGKGQNLLGRAWMKIRADLRDQDE
jgi:ribA/ribD-fused uncharacterized protein